MSHPNANASRYPSGDFEVHILGQTHYITESEALSLYDDLKGIVQAGGPRYDVVTVETTDSVDDHEGVSDYSVSKDFIDVFGPAGHTTYNTAHVVRMTVTEAG